MQADYTEHTILTMTKKCGRRAPMMLHMHDMREHTRCHRVSAAQGDRYDHVVYARYLHDIYICGTLDSMLGHAGAIEGQLKVLNQIRVLVAPSLAAPFVRAGLCTLEV